MTTPRWGHLVSIPDLILTVWSHLLRTDPPDYVPVGSAWLALGVICAFSLFLLSRKVRACEISA